MSKPNPQDFGGADGVQPSVCVEIQRARLQAGHELADVSTALRIRLVHLQALEDGRFDDLPGKTYVAGFLRSYAEYLGLDKDEITERFKAETEIGVEEQPELSFPSPTKEGSLPKPWLIVLVLMMAGVAYGGWHYYSTKGDIAADLVSDVSDTLAGVAGLAEEEVTADSLEADDVDESLPLFPAVISEAGEPVAESPAQDQAVAEPTESVSSVEQEALADDDGAVPVQAAELESPGTDFAGDEFQEDVVSRTAESGTSASAEPIPEPEGSSSASSEEVRAPARTTHPIAAARSALQARTNVEDEPDIASETIRESDQEAADTVAAESSFAPDSYPAISPPESDTTELRPLVEEAAEPAEQGGGALASTEASDEETPALVESLWDEPASVQRNQTGAASEEPRFQTNKRDPQFASVAEASPGVSDYVPQVYGERNSDSRVVITATDDAWVQVQGPQNELLLTRILRAGDSYRVPDREGLMLVTGNAGALQISVDGTLVAPIGPVGVVRRNVSLDPNHLATTSIQ